MVSDRRAELRGQPSARLGVAAARRGSSEMDAVGIEGVVQPRRRPCRNRRGSEWGLALWAALALGGCRPDAAPLLAGADGVVAAAAEGAQPAVAVYLIGDAGKPAPGGDPVLIAAERLASRDPDRSVVVFLGDNLYPDGLPDAQGPRRVNAERVLQAQLDVPLSAGARGIFVAGNHDWDHSGPEGWAEAMLEQRFIAENGRGRVELLPGDGCPGPAVRDFGRHLRLIALDTQWWLHPYDKPRPPPDVCPAASDPAVIDLLRQALREAEGRPVVVLAHHPLVSGGTHGVFPLLPTRFAPVPKFSAQDLGHPQYRHMRRVLTAGFRDHPPLVFAAGHDHNLQLLHGVGARFQIVSGTGIYGHTGPVRKLPSTIYRKRASGFMRLSVLPDGGVRLDAFTVNAGAESRLDFSTMLAAGRDEPAPSASP